MGIFDYETHYVYKEVAPYTFKEMLYNPITKEYKDICEIYNEDIISFPPYCCVKMLVGRWYARHVHFFDCSVSHIMYSSNNYIDALTNICSHYVGNAYAGRCDIEAYRNMEINYDAIYYSGGYCISYNILIGHLVLYNPNIYPEEAREQFKKFLNEYGIISKILGKNYFTEGIEEWRKVDVSSQLLSKHRFIKRKKLKHYLL